MGSGRRFVSYLSEVLGGSVKQPQTLGELLELVKRSVEKLRVRTDRLKDWDGFSQNLFGNIHTLKEQVMLRRMERGTFKHERQVQAEAEVAVITSQVRAGYLKLPHHHSTNAFFLTHSRVVDNLDGLPRRLSITPESLFQWLLSVRVISADQAKAVFDQILYDLCETGHQLLQRDKILRSFSGVIEAGKDTLQRVLGEHKEILYEIYGEDPAIAFTNIDSLEIPDAAEQLSAELLRLTEQRLAEEERKRKEAEKRAEKLQDLEKYVVKREAKRREAQKRKRAAQSRTGRKKRKRKRKKKR